MIKYHEHLNSIFFAYFLVLLAGWPCFHLVVIGLTIGLAISGAKLMGKKVAIGFSKWFL